MLFFGWPVRLIGVTLTPFQDLVAPERSLAEETASELRLDRKICDSPFVRGHAQIILKS